MSKEHHQYKRLFSPILAAGIALGGVKSAAPSYYTDNLRMELNACQVVHYSYNVPILSYGNTCSEVGLSRAGRWSKECDTVVPTIPNSVVIPQELNDCFYDAEFVMFEQTGPTCYLTCIAAAISDLSVQQGKPAIDPLLLSDLIAIASYDADFNPDMDIADVNTSITQLAKIASLSLHNGLTFNFEANLLDTVPDFQRDDPHELVEFIARLMEDPHRRVIYSTRVDENAYHAVLVLDYGIDTYGTPYLLVAEPNGGNFEDGQNAALVSSTWETLAPPGGFLTKVSLTADAVANISRLTGVRLLAATP
ncbi:MAG: hypothetical protein UZ22_OP11002000903 [Microgenomates bacterium OLB23]|nr:MAG: hypothetical protein UZ22_OP11002000903 [Microgenomates bacterium OLB23]